MSNWRLWHRPRHPLFCSVEQTHITSQGQNRTNSDGDSSNRALVTGVYAAFIFDQTKCVTLDQLPFCKSKIKGRNPNVNQRVASTTRHVPADRAARIDVG